MASYNKKYNELISPKCLFAAVIIMSVCIYKPLVCYPCIHHLGNTCAGFPQLRMYFKRGLKNSQT